MNQANKDSYVWYGALLYKRLLSSLATPLQKTKTFFNDTIYGVLYILDKFNIQVWSKSFAKHAWRVELAKLLSTVDKDDQTLYTGLLERQYNCDMQRGAAYRQDPISLREITKHTLDRLSAVRELIGVQPLTLPVGLVYTLQYSEVEQEKEEIVGNQPPQPENPATGTKGKRMTLDVVSNVVEARSTDLPGRLPVEASQEIKGISNTEMKQALYVASGQENANEHTDYIVNLMLKVSHRVNVESVNDERELLIHINRAANEIAKRTRRGAGNFIVVDSLTLSRLQDIGQFSSTPEQEKKKMHWGSLIKVGILNSTIVVYSGFHLAENTILIGYKGGTGEIDTGIIWSPYVMTMLTGPAEDPKTFQPVLHMMTRGGYTVVDNAKDYYVTLTLPPLKEILLD